MSRRYILLFTLIWWSTLNVQSAFSYRLSDNIDHLANQIMADAVVQATRQAPTSNSEGTALMPRSVTTPRHPAERKKWGVDKEELTEYWFNNRIHTFGNTGLLGALHAAVAPMATKMIDDLAYNGVDARVQLAEKICQGVKKEGARILDLCCGVGFSTRALHAACPEAEVVIGVDTSPEMVAMARFMTDHIETMRQRRMQVLEVLKPILPSLAMAAYWMVGDMMKRATTVASFVKGNAQRTTFPDKSFDLVTIMYAFHEAPRHGRYLMLREARRLLDNGGKLAIVDICPTYTPSPTMLVGEPYVLEYQENILKQIESIKGFRLDEYQTIIPGQLVMWTLTRDNKAQHGPQSK